MLSSRDQSSPTIHCAANIQQDWACKAHAPAPNTSEGVQLQCHTNVEVGQRLTSDGGPEEDEGQAEGAILLLDLPGQHHKQQHVGQHVLEAGVN